MVKNNRDAASLVDTRKVFKWFEPRWIETVYRARAALTSSTANSVLGLLGRRLSIFTRQRQARVHDASGLCLFPQLQWDGLATQRDVLVHRLGAAGAEGHIVYNLRPDRRTSDGGQS